MSDVFDTKFNRFIESIQCLFSSFFIEKSDSQKSNVGLACAVPGTARRRPRVRGYSKL